MALFVVQNYDTLDLMKRDSMNGNTYLHLACKINDLEIAKLILSRSNVDCKEYQDRSFLKDIKIEFPGFGRSKKYEITDLALLQNFKGETPIHLAILTKNLDLLSLFESRKQRALLIKDMQGENPLFYAARTSKTEIFNWFYMVESGSQSDYFKARGDQNYKGQTIEHIVCMAREPESVIYSSIKPRPDITDYYGNLPIFYALMRNDAALIQEMYKKQKDYFTLRNYKNQSIFHVAAKHNALDALKILIDIHVFSD